MTATFNADENRVERLLARIGIDTRELDTETTAKLLASAQRVIDRVCTVKRSLNSGVEAATEVQRHEA